MNEQKITGEWIDRYNEGTLSEAERIVFEQQLKVDPVLRAETKIDADLNILMSDKERFDLREKITEIIERRRSHPSFRKYLLIAASVALMLAAGGWCYLLFIGIQKPDAAREGEVQQEAFDIRVNSDSESRFEFMNEGGDRVHISTSGIDRNHASSTDYEPVPEYEMLVGSVTRNYQLILKSPPQEKTVKKGTPVRFEWVQQSHISMVSLLVLNNRGAVIVDTVQADNNVLMLETSSIKPGLYYWKLLEEDNLVTMGKIFIQSK